MAGRGRPKKPVEEMHHKQYRIRLSDDDQKVLNYLSEWYGLPISECIRMCCEEKMKKIRSAFGEKSEW